MWNRADRKKMSGDDVEKVRTKVEKRLDENFGCSAKSGTDIETRQGGSAG